MADFHNHIGDLIQQEGGSAISDDPDDRGGLTKYGISQKAFPDLEIRDLTEEMARSIYYRDYWEPLGLGKIWTHYDESRHSSANAYADLIVHNVFFFGVNAGVRKAARYLQVAHNCVRRESDPGLIEDGIVGPKTLAGVNSCIANGGGRSLHVALAASIIMHYADLVHRAICPRKFLRGWLNRVYF